MANWTDLSAAFGYGTKLTSTQMQQLRDNITAVVEGASGAPEIETAALKVLAVTTGKINNEAVTEAKIKSGNVTRSRLASSVGEVSTFTSTHLELPGGSYGFYPRIKKTSSGLITVRIADSYTSGTAYKTMIYLDAHSQNFAYAQQRYVTGSGEVFWIFYLIDKKKKSVIATWSAPDHPCFGNHIGLEHPFPDYDDKKHIIVVVNPNRVQLEEMRSRIGDRSLLQVINEDYKLDLSAKVNWPDKKITVGLNFEDKDIDKPAEVIKQKIEKPTYIKLAKLELKK
jgi:hypothetical protein